MFIKLQCLISNIFGNLLGTNQISNEIKGLREAILKESGEEIAEGVVSNGFIKQIKENLPEAIKAFNSPFNEMDIKATGVAGKFEILRNKTGSFVSNLTQGISPMAKFSLGIGAIATAGVILYKVYDEMTISAEEASEATKELMSSYKSALDSANNNAKAIEELIVKYEDLSKGVDGLGKNVSLTNDEYNEYNALANKIANMFPTLVKGYTNEGNAILSLKGNVEKLRDAYKEAQKEAYNLLIVSGEDSDGNNIVLDYQNQVNGYTTFITDFLDLDGEAGAKDAVDIITRLTGALTPDEFRETYNKLYEEYKDVWNSDKIQNALKSSGFEELTHAPKWSNITAQDLENAKHSARATIQTYQAEIDSKLKNVQTLANAYLMTNEDYAKLDEQSQNVASILVNSFDMDTASAFNTKEDVGAYVAEVVALLRENQGNPQVQNALYGLFTTDFSNLSVDDAKTIIDNYISTLAKLLNEDENQLKIRLGFTTYDDSDSIKTKVQGFLSDDVKGLDGRVGELTLSDLKIASELDVEEGTINSWEQLLKLIKEAKAEKEGELTIVDSVKQIAKQLEPQFAQLGEAYRNIFTDEGFTLKNVDNSMLEGLRESFAEIESSLGVSFNSTELEGFFSVLTNGNSTAQDVQNAFNGLATSYINSTDVLEKLNDETANSVAKQLEQMGVTNAEEVVTTALTFKKEKLRAEEYFAAKQKEENIEITEDSIDSLLADANACEFTSNAYKVLLAEEIMFGNNELNVAQKVNALNKIAAAAHLAKLEYSSLHTSLSGEEKFYKALSEGFDIDMTNMNDWMYIYDGVKYDTLDEAMLAKQYDEFYSNLSKYSPDLNFNGNTGSNSNSSSSSDSKQSFDWVEKLIANIQRQITNLGKTVDATYKKWTTRNSALVKQLSAVNSEIAVQRQAASTYWAKANSVGLSQTYKDLVNSGDYSIQDISNETLKEKIQEYEEWANKAKDAEDAIADLEAELANLAKSKFDNVISEFEDQLSVIEHRTSMIEGELDQIEAQGYIASTKYYDKLIILEEENIGKLSEEYSRLKEEFAIAMASGNIEKYSSDWYEMQSSILDVESALQEANAQLIEYKNNMRELEWSVFDKTQEMISQIQGESDWLIELMSNEKMYDDNGNWTEYADATAGLHAVNYNAYMSQADDYAKEIEEINEDLAKDPYNTLLLERRQELLEAQRDMISSAEDEKQAMKDLVSEGYNVMLEALQEMVDKRKEALQAEKDLYDYEKTISEKTKNIGSLEKQLQSYEGDDSEEAAAKIQQIKVDLEEAREDLEQTEYERYLSDQEQMLDTLVDDTEQWINERLDDLDAVIREVIESTNENSSSINDTLTEATDKVGATLTEEMQHIWGEGSVVAKYGEGFDTQLTGVNNTLTSIRDLVQSMVGASDEEASKDIANVETNVSNVQNTQPVGGGAGNTPSTPSNTNQNNSASGNKGSFFVSKKYSITESQLNKERSIVDRLKWKGFNADFAYRAKYYEGMGLGSASSYKATASQNIAMLNWMKSNGYKTGSRRIPSDELAWTQENGQELIYRSSDGAMLTPLGAGDAVFTNEMTQRLWDIAKTPEILSHLTTTTLPKGIVSNGMNNNIQNDVVMNISLPNVVDGDSFLRVIQTDKRIEKALQSMTLGNALGKNSLNKYKY